MVCETSILLISYTLLKFQSTIVRRKIFFWLWAKQIQIVLKNELKIFPGFFSYRETCITLKSGCACVPLGESTDRPGRKPCPESFCPWRQRSFYGAVIVLALRAWGHRANLEKHGEPELHYLHQNGPARALPQGPVEVWWETLAWKTTRITTKKVSLQSMWPRS